MLHEVIITLLGANGPLQRGLCEFVDFKPYLDPSEIEQLNSMLQFGKDYRYLMDFIALNRFGEDKESDDNLRVNPGLYIRSFVEALDEILEPYRQSVVSLEKEVLASEDVTLLHLYSRIEKHKSVLTGMCSLVKQIKDRKIHGCKILQVLRDNNTNVLTEMSSVLNRIQQKCHVVLLKQISSWVLNAYLLDPYKEFFIEHVIHSSKSEDDSISKSYQLGYNRIAASFIPSYVPYSLVADVLFIGQTVKVVNDDRTEKFALLISKESTIFKDKEQTFYDNFRKLLKSEFNIEELENVIREIRTCVVEHLWEITMKEEHFLEELQHVKNFYLVGYGEFYEEMLKKFKLFSRTSTIPNLEQELNWFLQNSEHLFIPSVDEVVIEKFCFATSRNSCATKSSATSRTDEYPALVSLEYKSSWPLSLLFDKNTMFHYNKLLFFLLRIKKCKLNLQDVLLKHIKCKSSRKSEKVFTLRNSLIFFINNLQFYLQVDVIETEYAALLDSIKKVTDFREIVRLHHMFLLNVLHQAFISWIPDAESNKDAGELIASMKPHVMNEQISKILYITEKFCALVLRYDEFNERQLKELNVLCSKFDKYRYVLVCLVCNLLAKPSKENLSKFLLRLNYNGWFMKDVPLQYA